MSKHWTPAESELHRGVGDLHLRDVTDDTKVTSSRLYQKDALETPLVTPIYNTTTYKVPDVKHYLGIVKDGGYIYSRLGNPTCAAAEAAISAIEGGAGSQVFSSGMAAISTALLAFLKAGDHVIACNPLYSGTHSFLSKRLSQYNIELTWVPTGCTVDEYKKHVKPNTKVLFGETPCNPLISIIDLEEFGKLGQSLDGVITMVDSTYGSPYLQQPHKYGVDLVIHSGTKYIGGHSDVLAGVVSTRTKELWQELNIWRCSMGTVLSPYDAFLLTRGIKTLHVRMPRHCSNALRLAEFLESHPKVAKVYYPGLLSHPGHIVAKKQMKMFGGMVAFEMKGGLETARALVENVRLIQLAVSLGGVESLIEHPATMTHGSMVMSDDDRREAFITDGLIRFSVGLEDPTDLVKDLKHALDKVIIKDD